MKTGTHFKLFCFSTVATVAIGIGLAGFNATQLGELPADLRGEAVNFVAKADRLDGTAVAAAQTVARRTKSNQIHMSLALFTGSEPARGGVLDQVASIVTTGRQVVNRLDKADVRRGAFAAQWVARSTKTDLTGTTFAAHETSRHAAAKSDTRDMEPASANRSDKASRLGGALLAQAVDRSDKTDMARMIVASLAPAKPAIQPSAQPTRTEIVTAALQKPLVFVPVTVLYDRATANLAEPTPHDPVTKVLWE